MYIILILFSQKWFQLAAVLSNTFSVVTLSKKEMIF